MGFEQPFNPIPASASAEAEKTPTQEASQTAVQNLGEFNIEEFMQFANGEWKREKVPSDVIPELTAEQIASVQEWSHAWLEHFRNDPDEMTSRDWSTNTDILKFELIKRICEEGSSYSTAGFQQAAKIFVTELIDYVNELDSTVSKNEVRTFLENHHEALCGGSPTSSDFLKISDLLTLTAKATQNPLIQGYFGQEMMGTLVYRLRFSSPEVYTYLKEECLKLPTEDLLDVLHMLQTAGASAVGSSWSESVAPRIRDDIFKALASQHHSPLVGYTANLSEQRLQQEQENPSVGIVHRTGDPHFGRLRALSKEEINQEHIQLATTIYPLTEIQGKFYHKVAKDAVALLDHSMLPTSLGIIPNEQHAPASIRTSVVKNLLENFEHAENFSERVDSLAIVKRVAFDMIAPHESIDPNDLSAIAKKLHSISPVKTTKEWTTVLQVNIIETGDVKEQITKKKIQLNEEAENEMKQLSDAFALSISEAMQRLAEAMEDQMPGSLADAHKELSSSQEDPETLFQTAVDCLDQVEFLEQTTPYFKGKELYTETFTILRERYQESTENIWENVNEKFRQFQYQISKNKKKMFQPVFAPGEFEIFLDDVKEYTETLDKELRETLPNVAFESYRDIPNDTSLNPFNSDNHDLPLLLRHLHSPELRHRIEEDLGIDLRSIPLRSQVYFLKFLASQDTTGFTRIKEVLKQNPEASNDILTSFLACADDMQSSETVLQLGELLSEKQAKLLFGRYASITDKTSKVRDYLHKEFTKSGEVSEGDIEQVIQNLLVNAKHLLTNYLKSIQKNSNNVEEIMKNMDELLDNVDEGVVLYGSAFHRYFEARKKEGQRVDFNELKNTVIDIKSAPSIETEERGELLKMFELNRAEYSPQLLSVVEKELQEAFDNPHSKFYILRTDGTLTAFIRFDDHLDGTKYAASLNVRTETHGSSIGTAIMQTTIEDEGRHSDLTAVVRKGNKARSTYERDFGFQVDENHPLENYKGTDATFFPMVRPKTDTNL